MLALLSRAPSLTCLVTSRRRLALPGEREVAVPPLPLPTGSLEHEGSLEPLAQCASVQLFVNRTQAIQPDFQITRRNAAAVAGLCADLEGIPLALELAAARAQTLTPAQMRAGLAQRFEMLATRHADKDARHRSLWATIAWSVDLLPPDMRRFWADLSVFRGGGTTEAAQAVTGDPQALERWTQLRERSLLTAETGVAGMRFRLLESLRQFAWEQLDAEERQAVARRHAEYFLQLALDAEPKLRGPEQGKCLAALEEDHDNFRAALDWAGAHDPPLELRLASALSFFWAFRGHLREGRERLALALSRAGTPPNEVKSKALHSSGVLAYWQCDYPAARVFYTEALALRRLSGPPTDLIKTLQNLAAIDAYQNDYDGARALFEESLALSRPPHVPGDRACAMPALLGLAIIAQWQGEWAQARERYAEALWLTQAVGDRRSEAAVLFNLAELDRGQGQETSAQDLLEKSLILARELGDQTGVARAVVSLGYVTLGQDFAVSARIFLEEGLAISRRIADPDGVANALAGLGDVACQGQNWPAAHAAYAESLSIKQGLGDARQIAGGLQRLGILAARQGQFARGARLLGAAQALRETLAARVSPLTQSEWDAALASVRAALAPEDFDAAFAEGQALAPDAAVAFALQPPAAPKRKKRFR